jgi:eukaryotic translation initiation factor 2C
MFFGVALSRNNSDTAPSLAALCASKDPEATQYSTYLRALDAKSDLVEDMAGLTKQALDDFFRANNRYPKRIVHYRDGVSVGRFPKLIEKEVGGIKTALIEMNLNCSVTTVAFQKNHHIRLFPTGAMDRSGNCMPGTVVDTCITHPTEFNFVLQSHAGIQGMSKPTIYHVLYDENNFSSDELQDLTFKLCFLSERATRSISVVAPAYRASIAANCNF